ncbi:hypothetical protein POM88_049116 [Heracleum sosnowskyi]|uniref:Leucine-rich repeat-containing N-terminal plant-type domain-containing protein n=1 Tax=Heracleum sosnowskyi TaxID=360622 RepID=A0AAD8LZ80_9APIA|nr:hypothetical protein POM88_049116 [Heracleum sosnowskyi]
MQLEKPCHFVLFVFFLSLLSINLGTVSTTRAGEALVKWKNSLARSTLLDFWSLDNLTYLCNWTAITCNAAGSVTEINLSGKELAGTLAKFDFSSFPNLNSFTVEDNYFRGPIPPAIGDLTQLQYLNLSCDLLHESVFNNLHNLQSLNLLGCISDDIRLLHNLKFLSIKGNFFEGSFPPNIFKLSKLTDLDLSYNKFSGSIPSDIKMLLDLESLYLDGNSFEGSFPPNILKLSKLRFLDLSSNNFSGSIPNDIKMLRNLIQLWLHSNSFEGAIPSSISLLGELRYLNLGHNHLNSSIPSDIGNLELQYLNLSSNQFTGPLPKIISNLTNLLVLGLNDNKFSGNIPSNFLKDTTFIDTIDFSNNNLSGNIPKEFSVHWNLECINLSGNCFTGEIPATICNATSLQILDLSNNGFSGALPHCLGNLADKMLSIDLGNIPLGLELMGKLGELCISFNNLTGNILFDIGNLKLLERLVLNSNQLTGVLPRTIYNLTNLKILCLKGNRFSGNIPRYIVFKIRKPWWFLRHIGGLKLMTTT